MEGVNHGERWLIELRGSAGRLRLPPIAGMRKERIVELLDSLIKERQRVPGCRLVRIVMGIGRTAQYRQAHLRTAHIEAVLGVVENAEPVGLAGSLMGAGQVEPTLTGLLVARQRPLDGAVRDL